MQNIQATISRQGDLLSITEWHILIPRAVVIHTKLSQDEWDMIMNTPRELVREVLEWYEGSEKK